MPDSVRTTRSRQFVQDVLTAFSGNHSGSCYVLPLMITGNGMDWHLYMLDCDGRFYTGIATDPERRLAEHRSGTRRAAKFTRAARTHTLVYAVALGERSIALRAEARVKKLSRLQKQELIEACPGREALLAMLNLECTEGMSA